MADAGHTTTGRDGVRVLVTAVPFAGHDRRPLELLERAGIDYLLNPHNCKLTEDQLAALVPGVDALIAGTEPITDRVLARADRLRLISRVGIGLDSVDLLAARARGIKVAYTPDAPAAAVSELTIGVMLSLLRSIHRSNNQVHAGGWQRLLGRRLGDLTVGIIGVGRVGRRVLRHLEGFSPRRVLLNDLAIDDRLVSSTVQWTTRDALLRESDVVTIHVPLTAITRNMVRREQLLTMKPDAVIINTARGGIINERELHDVLVAGHLSGAALDVFEHEPYSGPLAATDRCLLTAHMGSMAADCRSRMELEATAETISFLDGQPLHREVPQDEYDAVASGMISPRDD
jgi:D-3-phosphoglycerate dehydrogenase